MTNHKTSAGQYQTRTSVFGYGSNRLLLWFRVLEGASRRVEKEKGGDSKRVHMGSFVDAITVRFTRYLLGLVRSFDDPKLLVKRLGLRRP